MISEDSKRMIRGRTMTGLLLLSVTVMFALIAGANRAQAGVPPIKEILETRMGANVNGTTGANVCTVTSRNSCIPAEPSAATGGFNDPEAITATSAGDVYVADTNNHRVDELESDGKFIRMFGKQVNKTAHQAHEAANENVCPVKEHDECEAGIGGIEVGEISTAVVLGITINPLNGDIYLAEGLVDSSGVGGRIQEFTPEGVFVLEIGNEVNGTSKADLCTREEEKTGVTCVPPVLRPFGAGRKPAELFMSAEIPISAGGTEGLLYAGDEHRIQEFEANGKYKRELPLTRISEKENSRVTALAAQEKESLFFTYEVGFSSNTIYRLNSNGEETKESGFPAVLTPREPLGGYAYLSVLITALAIDPSGRLAVAELETLGENNNTRKENAFGSLLSGDTGHLITEFKSVDNEVARGVGFGGADELFAAATEGEGQEVLGYRPVPVGELVTQAPTCVAGPEHGVSDTFNCALNGTVNPYKVAGTEARFQWGTRCPGGSETLKEPINPPVEEPLPVSAPVRELVPNETLCYHLIGEDENVKAPEELTSESVSYETPDAPPKIVGEPDTIVTNPFSAVMFGEVNPEHTNTTYYFEYGPCEDQQAETQQECAQSPYPSRTSGLESSQYGTIGATLEATDLQPGTLYHYRLSAVNEKNMSAVNQDNESVIPAGMFTTASAPRVQVETGSASTISTTSAVVMGTVDPDGQATAYQFELGVYDGAGTQYGSVFSGSAGNGVTPVQETLLLSGLQPGTQYAYRISAHSGSGSTADSTATGMTQTFTTAGEPDALGIPEVLPQLLTPNTKFPVSTSVRKVATSTNAEKLAKALKACKKKRSLKERMRCETSAHKKFPVKKTEKKH